MGQRNVKIRASVVKQVAGVAWFIESKGLVATAERFTDDVYDFIEKLGDTRKSYRVCRDPKRGRMGLKCVSFKRKYTIVILEDDEELTICEFIPSRLIKW